MKRIIASWVLLALFLPPTWSLEPGPVPDSRGPVRPWRAGLTAAQGLWQSHWDRSKDFTGWTDLGYEFSLGSHASLTPRLLPLFLYHGPEQPEVAGVGAGIAGRFYPAAGTGPGTHQGFFFEGQFNALAHDDKITGNSSNLNFVSCAGPGYRFSCGLEFSALVGHISNANLGKGNEAVNLLGAGIGYRF